MKSINFEERIKLSNYTTIKVGGFAEYFAKPKNTNEFINLIKWSSLNKKRCHIIGAGSNLLINNIVLKGLTICTKTMRTLNIDSITGDWMGLDIGPDSIKVFQKALSDCKTIIWNGPMGVFEFDKFANGTNSIAETLAELSSSSDVCTIIGGGDSVAAVEKAGLADKMSHISTGGGASLELLEGKVLPGVAALND